MMHSYRTLQRVIVRRQPSYFADELRRIGRNHVFTGWLHIDPAWVERLDGGFVARKQVFQLGRRADLELHTPGQP